MSYMEDVVQADCRRYLKQHPDYYVWRNNTGRRGGISYGFLGSADCIGLYKTGRFVGIEFKAKGKDLSPSQEDWKEGIEKMNGVVIVAHSLEEMLGKLDIFEAVEKNM